MANNRISKTPYRNCQKMTITRQAKIQKIKEQRERNRAKYSNYTTYEPVSEKKLETAN